MDSVQIDFQRLVTLKMSDAGDIITAIFLDFPPNLGIFRSFQVILGHFRPFKAILGNFRQFQAIFRPNFRPF